MSDEPEIKHGWLRPLWQGLTKWNKADSPEVIYEGDSEYHHITITEKDGIRTLRFGADAQEAETSVSVANPDSPIFEYPGMFFLGLALTPKNKNILMLGLGGGYIPNIFKKYLKDHNLTVVEVDPMVAELASVYFGFETGGNVRLVISDGLEFVARSPASSYDQIWLDAFNGNYIPSHLCDHDFLAMVKLKLVEDGLAIQNLHQTAWLHFQSQLQHTVRVFNQKPLLFSGTRSANTVSMSLNSALEEIPLSQEAIVAKIKAFRPKVGPYALADEALKLVRKQPRLEPQFDLPF
jgi:spermidine synthase